MRGLSKVTLRGSVRFCAYGGFLDAFLQHCVQQHIPLQNVHNEKGGICADIPLLYYKKLRPAAHASGCRLKVLAYHGYPAAWRFFVKNAGIFIGLTLAAAIFMRLSGGIWRIEVRGNEMLYFDEVTAVLQQCGIRYGTRKKGLDIDQLEAALSVLLEEKVHWLSLNIEGCTALLELKEKPSVRHDAPLGQPCNVVAAFDGIVESLSIRSGRAVVEPGSAVKKGDLLISGIIQNADGTTSLYEADGDCLLRHSRQISADCSGTSFFSLSDEKKGCTFDFFDIHFAFPLPGKQDRETLTVAREYKASVGGVVLPVGGSFTTLFTPKAYEPDSEELSLIASQRLLRAMLVQLDGSRLIRAGYVLFDGCAAAEAECIELAARKVPIQTQTAQ